MRPGLIDTSTTSTLPPVVVLSPVASVPYGFRDTAFVLPDRAGLVQAASAAQHGARCPALGGPSTVRPVSGGVRDTLWVHGDGGVQSPSDGLEPERQCGIVAESEQGRRGPGQGFPGRFGQLGPGAPGLHLGPAYGLGGFPPAEHVAVPGVMSRSGPRGRVRVRSPTAVAAGSGRRGGGGGGGGGGEDGHRGGAVSPCAAYEVAAVTRAVSPAGRHRLAQVRRPGGVQPLVRRVFQGRGLRGHRVVRSTRCSRRPRGSPRCR